MIYWNDPQYEVAEYMFNRLMPLISEKEHSVLIHGISDSRYSSNISDADKSYWQATRHSITDKIITDRNDILSILNFISFNNLTLFSADHSLHSEPEKHIALHEKLGNMFSTQGHWRWFTLNEKEGPFIFPREKTSNKVL